MSSHKSKIRRIDLLLLALSSLGSNKLRTILTVLGVSIGVFSVVGVMTTLTALRSNINSGLSFLEATVFQIKREPAMRFTGRNDEWRKRPRINPQQAFEFQKLMTAEGIIVSLTANDAGKRIKYKDKKTSPVMTLTGSNEHFLTTNKYELEYGRNINEGDLANKRSVAVIGKTVEQELFPNTNPAGKTILIGNNRYEVIGVLKEKGDRFGMSMDNFALIPITQFVSTNWNRWRSMQISAQAPSIKDMQKTQDLAIGKMRIARGLKPEDSNNFEISSNDSSQEAFENIASIVTTGGLLISSIALLCSGIGIMNIMLVSVTERTREIGIRKSLGARKKDILYQFLIESVFLSELGAIIGILLGITIGNLLAHQMDVPMLIPWDWIATAVIICSIIGIGFGLYPAWRAANLRPVDALRYE
jgi:putative ABC transport system permease protein